MPFGHSLCYNRNRAYAPGLGRFLQMDPNASAMALIESAAHHGRGAAAIAAAFDIESMYGDGYNLYEYLSSSPWSRFDPMGLAQDPFDMVDEYIAEYTGSIAGFINQLIGAAKAAAFVGAMVLSMAPFPVTAIAGEIGMQILEGEVPPELQMAAKVLGYATMGAMLGVVAKIGYNAIKSAVYYVAKHGLMRTIRNIWNGARNLIARAKRWLSRKPPCTCFAAGTVVWTIVGLVPVESVRPGDLVLTRDVPYDTLSFAKVSDVATLTDATHLDIVFATTSGLTLVRTTGEHPFWVVGQGWTPASVLRSGDMVSTVGIADAGEAVVQWLSYPGTRGPVHNFTVEGAHSYLVGVDGLVVHNCPAFNAIKHYWEPMYGWTTTPRMVVRVRDIRTGAERLLLKLCKFTIFIRNEVEAITHWIIYKRCGPGTTRSSTVNFTGRTK